MAASAGSVSLVTAPRAFFGRESPKVHSIRYSLVSSPWKKICSRGVYVRPVAVGPEKLSEKVEESIKNAQEACSDNPVSGECVAAWDEVEELSAAASHARDRKKESDPLETFCKDNPEDEECRTYDN